MDGACIIMAETTAVFDVNVFDFAFDVVDVIPALLKVVVERPYRAIAAGQGIAVVVHLIDNTTTPGRSFPFNPVTLPTIEIFSPEDISILAESYMRQIGDGVFSYSYQTAPSHQVGNYSAIFRCVNGSKTMMTKKHVVSVIT